MARLVKKPVVLISLAIILLLAAGLGIFLLHRNTFSAVPTKIKQKVGFTILEAQPDTNWYISPNSVSYNKDSGVLTMTAVSGSLRVAISEQAQPGSFTDVPQVYPALLNKLNQYEDIQMSVGTVTLTHPKELKGGQTAVADLRQTLIFVRPATNLTDSQWKDFFDAMMWD